MSKEHVSTWTATVYMVHVTRFPRGSVYAYIVYVVITNIEYYFAKTRRGCVRLPCLQSVA